MKLYTEEQLHNTVIAISNYLDDIDLLRAQDKIEKHLKALAPIELPSDEEIKEAVENKFGLVDPILGKSNYRMGYESGLIKGAKWQQERSYSEEDMKLAFETGRNFQLTGEDNFNELIEQFKKK